ncbi:MAG: exo-alpha-sialidase [Ruminococcaceae bacterium]|nr:exo-alpha-sialidase [Oscillospiraceae bacterium]
MYEYIDRIEARMAEDERDMLRRIWEPTVVGVPLGDSRRDICILPDGEIRSYELFHPIESEEKPTPLAYLSSVDGGLSWKKHYARGIMHSCTYIEDADLYVTAVGERNGETGLWVYRSKIGPDDDAPEVQKLSDYLHFDVYLPKKSAFGKRIWFTTQRRGTGEDSERLFACYHYSDDFGASWKSVEVTRRDGFEIVFPHKGMRWSIRSGMEPYVEELTADCMVMMIRSPHDSFYLSRSHDGGESWSEPEPSTFYGTNTTPFMLRLRDGRTVTFWNNTKPLAEQNLRIADPPVANGVVIGRYEDAFTNRDAAHAAITEDGGKTYLGYREILLNPVRANADFRYVGDPTSSFDKSSHQFQAFELPYGKVLVSVGQNAAARRMLIFDVNWLYETARREDFLGGLKNITTHTYVKSISGSYIREVGNGHCAWNRAQNAYLMPDPNGGHTEALYICKRHDPRMFNDIGGAVWNFPASARGRVSIEVKLVEKQARFAFADRWYNTCDPYVTYSAPFWFELDVADIGSDFVRLDFDFDTERGMASLSVDGSHFFNVRMNADCPTGLSYLIAQCATDGDSAGFYLRLLEKTAR